MKVQNMTHAEQNARGHMDSIKALVAILETGGEYEGDTLTSEDVQDRISQYPLSLEVRASWHGIGETWDNRIVLRSRCRTGALPG
jgi:hypothetical protein